MWLDLEKDIAETFDGLSGHFDYQDYNLSIRKVPVRAIRRRTVQLPAERKASKASWAANKYRTDHAHRAAKNAADLTRYHDKKKRAA